MKSIKQILKQDEEKNQTRALVEQARIKPKPRLKPVFLKTNTGGIKSFHRDSNQDDKPECKVNAREFGINMVELEIEVAEEFSS